MGDAIDTKYKEVFNIKKNAGFQEYSGRSTVAGLRILKAQVQLPLNLRCHLTNPWKRDANIDYSFALMAGMILMKISE